MDTKKVIFNLTQIKDRVFDPDITEEEVNQRDERIRDREGIFHCWHEVEEWSPYLDKYLIKNVALIEDVATGEVHEVSHEQFKFIYD